MPTQTPEELQQQLADQVGFLKSSIRGYDAGELAEGKRLATTIRVLVHDTARSHSLLGQLGLMSGTFFDTADPEPAVRIGPYHGLIYAPIGQPGAAYVPACYAPHGPYPRFTFNDWWTVKSVVIDGQGNRFTRRDLVLALANRDGGSHVDPSLDDRYAALSRDNSLGWRSVAGEGDGEPLEHAPLACVRQIAHELLLSLGETPPEPPRSQVPLLGGGGIAFVRSFPRVGRNEPCPCGARKTDGKPVKYKRCHGR